MTRLAIAITIAMLAFAYQAARAQEFTTDYYGGDGSYQGSSTTHYANPGMYHSPGLLPAPIDPPVVVIQPQQPDIRYNPAFRSPGQPINPFATRR